jgi:3-oxoacyl-[acyl-carrier protein] reductase
MMMPNSCVLVTGGSGALGSAIVRRFRSERHDVAFTYRTNDEAAQKLVDDTGARAVRADLTDAAQVRAAVAESIDHLGQVDILVNCAGATQAMPFALIEEEDWDEIIDANLKSLFLVTKEVVRNMVGREAGVIVNIGSLAGQRLLEVPVHYATAKAGVSGFTVSLAAELRRYHIRVNSVIPGLLEEGVSRHVPERERADYLSHCAAGRAGRVGEVADLVYYLSSEKASYINAQNITIDGGL